MNNVAVLKPFAGRFSISPKYKRSSCADVFYIRDSFRLLKKTVKAAGGKKIIPDVKVQNMKVINKYLRKYLAVNIKTVLPVLEKIVRNIARQNGLKFPLAEICLSAEPETAALIISYIKDTAKLFTVISCASGNERIYDELYFKSGVIIRQIPVFGFNEKEDTMIIKADSSKRIPGFIKSPILSLVRENGINTSLYNAGSFYLSDGQADEFLKIWEGEPSVGLYTFLGLIPDSDAVIDINKKADDIFLLDTGNF